MKIKPWRRRAGLTGHVGAGAVVGPVLEEPVLAAHLLWFGVAVPAGLRTLRGAVLHRVVVQLEAFALWSHLSVLVTASVRRCETRKREENVFNI